MPQRRGLAIESSSRCVRRLGPWLWLPLALACAGPPPADPPAGAPSSADASGPLADDPAVRARRAGVEAAKAREGSAQMLDEVELRVGDEYLDEHQVRVVARLPIRHPGEVRAQREIFSAEAEIAESRLAETTLTRRAETCFPSVEAEARAAEQAIFDEYESRQELLLAYTASGRQSGLISEIDASRFELASRLRLATREPVDPPLQARDGSAALPSLGAAEGELVWNGETLREAVRRHHPSVALRRATAARYEALAARARSRNQPWIKFVDFAYEHRTGKERPGEPNGPSRNGGGGRVAFTIPFGGGEKANSRRYAALVREQEGEGEAVVEEQMLRGMQALQTLRSFEQRAPRLLELLVLANGAEAVADRWWESKLAQPGQVAGLLDEAFAARRAVLSAREEAGVARCGLLAMTGVAAEDWPRGPGAQSERLEPLAPGAEAAQP